MPAAWQHLASAHRFEADRLCLAFDTPPMPYPAELGGPPVLHACGTGALPGVVLTRVREAAARLGLRLAEGPPRCGERHLWQEAFITNCIKRVQPLRRVFCPPGKHTRQPTWMVVQEDACLLRISSGAAATFPMLSSGLSDGLLTMPDAHFRIHVFPILQGTRGGRSRGTARCLRRRGRTRWRCGSCWRSWRSGRRTSSCEGAGSTIQQGAAAGRAKVRMRRAATRGRDKKRTMLPKGWLQVATVSTSGRLGARAKYLPGPGMLRWRRGRRGGR